MAKMERVDELKNECPDSNHKNSANRISDKNEWNPGDLVECTVPKQEKRQFWNQF